MSYGCLFIMCNIIVIISYNGILFVNMHGVIHLRTYEEFKKFCLHFCSPCNIQCFLIGSSLIKVTSWILNFIHVQEGCAPCRFVARHAFMDLMFMLRPAIHNLRPVLKLVNPFYNRLTGFKTGSACVKNLSTVQRLHTSVKNLSMVQRCSRTKAKREWRKGLRSMSERNFRLIRSVAPVV